MAGTKIIISVPNIATISGLFDQIQVFRSVDGITGSYSEITAAIAQTATMTGTVVGPYFISGLTLQIRIDGGSVQTVTFVGNNPIATTSVISQINAAITGINASLSGGAIKLDSDGTGTDETIKIEGGTSTSFLGFIAGQYVEGKAARLAVIPAVDTYFFEDVAGSDEYYYKTRFYNSSTTSVSEYSDATQGALFEVIPEQHADSRAPRSLTLIRGSTHTFRFSFFEDAGESIPLVPKDVTRYPNYSIIDIIGQTIASGVAICDGAAGNYRIDFTVPTDAALSYDDRRWRIEILLITNRDRQVQQTLQFDVRDTDATESQIKELKYLALDGKRFRISIRLPKRPISMDVTVSRGQATNTILASASVGSGVTEIVDGETLVYYWDIPAGTLTAGSNPMNSAYLIIWTIQQSATSSTDFQYQVIEVPPMHILPYFASLRMVIDKYQKRRDIYQAYQDSDIYEYLAQGLRVVNGHHPLTQYDFNSLPTELAHYWLLGATFWGLNAQHLLETDLEFQFSGQTVTLGYDHRAGLSEGIERALGYLREGLTATKTPLYRRSQATGQYAGRTYRYNLLQNFVFKIQGGSMGGGSDFMTTLSNIGLL